LYKVKNLSRQYKICVKEGYTGVIDFEIRPKFWFVIEMRKKFREYLRGIYKLDLKDQEIDEWFEKTLKINEKSFLEDIFMDKILGEAK
jgi:hypothetical protein